MFFEIDGPLRSFAISSSSNRTATNPAPPTNANKVCEGIITALSLRQPGEPEADAIEGIVAAGQRQLGTANEAITVFVANHAGGRASLPQRENGDRALLSSIARLQVVMRRVVVMNALRSA